MRKELIQRAKNLLRAGYSVIPVQGNNAPGEPKKPAVSWGAYQRQLPSESDIERQFGKKVTALGIVCGRISKLLVIDFDDLLRYQRFCRHLPQYSETYTVKTKRGFHLYFRTAERVPSHQFDGGDIKGEKSYIIAPPSQIGRFKYRCVKDVPKITLDKGDVDRLLNYFHVDSACDEVSGKRIRDGSALDLRRLYQRLAARIGRNNALYRAASAAREWEIAKERAERELIELHVRAPSHPSHKYEAGRERMEEGLRTIDSAYRNKTSGRSTSGIPNSVRERLLNAQGSTAMARLLDIFVLAGWQADAYFTATDAIRVAERHGLNRKSVLKALTGEYSTYDGRQIISRRYVEYLDIEGLNSRKRGRPVELAFRVPAMSRLLGVLNVGRSPSDRMRFEDLKSAKSYRLAVHREYIRRLAPRSSLKTLARRLGVHERTVRRYNRALEVQLTACVGRLKLTRDVVATLPKRGWGARKNTTGGFWLESAGGTRLPAWRHIGAKLLNAGEKEAQICARLSSLFRLGGDVKDAVQFERMNAGQFARLAQMRSGGRGGLIGRLEGAVESLRRRSSGARYERIQLFFENVASRIADDKVSETINGYLVAYDGAGFEVRRPARRGIGYRMLKEYGNGNVYLALRSAYKDVVMSLARHALRAGDAEQGFDLLARTMA
ncbi:MAG: bifunctional DNA primase/polymerase [Chloroflexi bacterium]|nr:bifunctional DNA primase/polymerase [Chloroflexota bacterium]